MSKSVPGRRAPAVRGVPPLLPRQKQELLDRIDRAWERGELRSMTADVLAEMLRALFPDEYGPRKAARPTDAIPGTPRKTDTLCRRAEAGEELTHEGDPVLDEQQGALLRVARLVRLAPGNGLAQAGDVVAETAGGPVVVEATGWRAMEDRRARRQKPRPGG